MLSGSVNLIWAGELYWSKALRHGLQGNAAFYTTTVATGSAG